jgi:hypothetical protein
MCAVLGGLLRVESMGFWVPFPFFGLIGQFYGFNFVLSGNSKKSSPTMKSYPTFWGSISDETLEKFSTKF